MRRILSFILVFVLCLSSVVVYEVTDVKAEDLRVGAGNGNASNQFEVDYDSSKYTIYWVSRRIVVAESQYGSMWKNLDKDDALGSATIKMYYLEPKSNTNGFYYAIAGCRIDMNPSKGKGNVSGMSQYAYIGIETINADSRVCSPTVDTLEIQKNTSESTTNSMNYSSGLNYDSKSGGWGQSRGRSSNYSWGAAISYTYNTENVLLIQRNKDSNRCATWEYDYISKNGDRDWNKNLFSSTHVSGQVVYALGSRPTVNKRGLNIPVKLKYEVRFGAGDTSNGNVADRLGPSTNRDMFIKSETIYLYY